MRTNRWIVVVAVSVLLLATGCAIEVPDLAGLTPQEAEAVLVEHSLQLGSISYDPQSTAPLGTIVGQTIEIEDGDTPIDITLAGAQPVIVPDVVGLEHEQAIAALATTGLSPTEATIEYSDTVTATLVISQSLEPGTELQPDTSIDLVVSKGPEPPPSDTLVLERVHTTSGAYSPKSVVATQNGYVFAQNMIYRHTITVFDDTSYEPVKTISDTVRLADWGFDQYSGEVRGGPVEAAVTPDGKYVYVSNYSMYGPGFSHPGDDVGGPSSGVDPSFVYRIPTDTLEIDQVIKVGSVPKFCAVTPDGKYLLVSNWISYSLSVVDIAQGAQVQEISLGRYPRGIVVDSASQTAYVAIMGSRDIAKVDLATFEVSWIRGVGSSPRHLVMSPDDSYLYATLNGDGTIAKIDMETEQVIARVSTGSQPRSMSISTDGGALYVVNYESDSVSKVRTSDMKELQELPVGHHPIGITYVDETRDVWVSCYPGSFYVFHDSEPEQ